MSISSVGASAASPSSTTSSAASSAASASALGGLSQSDFLQLLVAQMQNQNPMDPTSGTEYMAELAQFSTVEGITQLNTSFSAQSLTQSAALIGQTVQYTDAKGNAASGVVNSVSMNNGQVALDINNTDVGLSQVQSID
jgi:flagellar basal-body rod modification protein FlgD